MLKFHMTINASHLYLVNWTWDCGTGLWNWTVGLNSALISCWTKVLPSAKSLIHLSLVPRLRGNNQSGDKNPQLCSQQNILV